MPGLGIGLGLTSRRGAVAPWNPGRLTGVAVWIDPNAPDALKSDQAGTTPATTVVRRVVGRDGLGFTSGNPTDANAARIDTMSYPGSTALFLAGTAAPFPTLSGVSGTGQSFTLAVDFVQCETARDGSPAELAPTGVGYYEAWTGSRYKSPIARPTFATIAAASSAFYLSRRRLIIRGNASSTRYWINGTEYTRPANDTTSLNGGSVGSFQGGGGALATMVFRELIQVNRAITDAEVNDLAAYWAARPTPAPFPTGLPLVMCDGNSLTAGGWPATAGSILGNGTVRVCNQGAVAFQTPTLASGAATFIDPWYSASRTRNIVTFQEGTNHIIAGASGATAYAAIESYCLARRAVGWKVVVLNVSPSTAITGAMETARTACNASIAANWATFADAFVDVTTGNFANPANTTYYSDGTHYTGVLNAEAAALVAAAVSPLL